jgi:hypothetical protein
MELKVDPRQPVQQTVGSREPGLTAEVDGRLVGPGVRQYSYWAECECPDDCLRDHENE